LSYEPIKHTSESILQSPILLSAKNKAHNQAKHSTKHRLRRKRA